jgi:iron complex transport system ATP-binding protein
MMLKVNKLSKHILKKISFELDSNTIILGSNGAGKSTLAKLICGLIESDSVEVFDKHLHSLDAQSRAKLVNYIPPKLEIFDEYISLYEYLELSHLDKTQDINKTISLLGLEHLKNKRCKRLSSGEQQLTLLASSILHNAKLTIFDEPTSNLDPQKTQQVYKLLKSDKIQNRIIITHDLNLAHKLGYKIVYIQNGEVLFFNENEKFFEEKNLKSIFGSSIVKADDHFVVNL